MTKKLFIIGLMSLVLFGCSQKTKNEPIRTSPSKITGENNQINDSQNVTVSAKVQKELPDHILKAQELFKKHQNKGTNFTDGPCLGTIEDGWQVDIVHNPRQVIDNRLNNQCPHSKDNSFKLIELDNEGKYISLKNN